MGFEGGFTPEIYAMTSPSAARATPREEIPIGPKTARPDLEATPPAEPKEAEPEERMLKTTAGQLRSVREARRTGYVNAPLKENPYEVVPPERSGEHAIFIESFNKLDNTITGLYVRRNRLVKVMEELRLGPNPEAEKELEVLQREIESRKISQLIAAQAEVLQEIPKYKEELLVLEGVPMGDREEIVGILKGLGIYQALAENLDAVFDPETRVHQLIIEKLQLEISHAEELVTIANRILHDEAEWRLDVGPTAPVRLTAPAVPPRKPAPPRPPRGSIHAGSAPSPAVELQ